MTPPSSNTPTYVRAHESGALRQRISRAMNLLSACMLCPRQCGVDRTRGEKGICKTGRNAVVADFSPHFGEETPLVGIHGSGTIFFANCNLLCDFCQNHDISHGDSGKTVTDDQLAWMMMSLQDMGCHNINLVTPSHVVPQILSAIEIAVPMGLHLPLVYNTGAYDRVETLRLLSGVVDIYMPDLKCMNPQTAVKAGMPEDYPETACSAIIEMHRQVGDLDINDKGLATRGVLLRHLVMPENMAETRQAMAFTARHLSSNTYINIMSQYRPMGGLAHTPPFDRPVTPIEFKSALAAARAAGLNRLDGQVMPE